MMLKSYKDIESVVLKTCYEVRESLIKQGVKQKYIDNINRHIEEAYRSHGFYIRVTTIGHKSFELDMLWEVSSFLLKIDQYVSDYYRACQENDTEARREALKYFKQYLGIFWGQANSKQFDDNGRIILFNLALELVWDIAGRHPNNTVINTFTRKFHKMLTKEIIKLNAGDRTKTV